MNSVFDWKTALETLAMHFGMGLPHAWRATQENITYAGNQAYTSAREIQFS